ncbi:MAG: MAC/perforin domain-containing protein, partial [Methylocella sp.]
MQRLNLARGGYGETSADSLSDISHKLTIEAGLKGSYSGVTGSIESKFGISGQQIEKTHFLKISFGVSADSYNLDKNSDQLKDLLEGGFKTALAGWPVDRLFKEYGTHLIKNILLGGRAEYFCYSSDTTSISATDFRAAAKLGYKQAGGSVQGSASVDTSQSAKLNLVQGRKTIDTIGGDAKAALGLTTGKWTEWATSCDAKPGFLGFAKEDGLIPIWDLAASPERSDAIRQAYLKKAAKAVRPHILSVTSDPAQPHPTASVTVPA